MGGRVTREVVGCFLVVLLFSVSACTSATQQPTINSFNASPSTISAGQASRLEWNVTGATSVSIEPGIGNVSLTGSTDVYPQTTTTYIIAATNSRGIVTATARVIVHGTSEAAGTPVINKFIASPDSISPGETSTINWGVSGAATVSIDQGIGNVGLTGTRLVSPSTTTTYTLTATNVNGSVTGTATVFVAGTSAGSEKTSQQSSAQSPPVINFFMANPTSISTNETSTLQWNVSNATQVTLNAVEGGIGWSNPVSLTGSRSVSPDVNATYTLTATNAAGSVTARVEVTVTGLTLGTLAQKPDLIITNINKKATASGPIIQYTIKNSGTGDAGASISRLYANGVQKATDSIPPLTAGSTITREFSAWIINPTTPVIKVVADANNTVAESNETNNEMQITLAITTAYDFIAKAPSAKWFTGSSAVSQPISWGGSTNDSNGFACYLRNIKMEDNKSYPMVMVTHPKWIDDGMIRGIYQGFKVQAGDRFYAKVGFVQGYNGKVLYRIYVRPVGGESTMVNETSKGARGVIEIIDVDLSSYAGKWVDITIGVDAYGPSTQDWASWIEAKIIRVF